MFSRRLDWLESLLKGSPAANTNDVHNLMNKNSFIFGENRRPNWLNYPRSFIRIVEQNLIHLVPWHILESNQVLGREQGLSVRYPTRKLFPFAYRQDNDDLACWEKDQGEKVFIIHDFAASGWENEAEFDNVWSWFRSAMEETINWD